MWIYTADGKLVNSELVYMFSYESHGTLARRGEGISITICNHNVVNEIRNALECGRPTIAFGNIKRETSPEEEPFNPYKVNWNEVRRREKEVGL